MFPMKLLPMQMIVVDTKMNAMYSAVASAAYAACPMSHVRRFIRIR